MMSNPPERERTELTSRQREVMRMIAEGRRVKEIADILELSPRSVEAIKSRLMQDLDLHSTAALIRYAIEHDVGAQS